MSCVATVVGVYGVLFMDTSEDESVFNGVCHILSSPPHLSSRCLLLFAAGIPFYLADPRRQIRAWVSDLGSDVFDNSPQRRDAVAELPEKTIQKERRSV